MKVRQARDVAELAIWLVDMWRPGAAYDLIATHYQQARGAAASDDSRWTREAIADARLFYLTAGATEQLAGVYPSWPLDGAVTDADAPSRCGLVVLETSLYGQDSENPGNSLAVDAILWAPIPGGVGIASYTKVSLPTDDEHAWQQVRTVIRLAKGDLPDRESEHGDWYLPLGRTDWRWGIGADVDRGPATVVNFESLIEDRCLLGSLWTLLSANAFAVTAQAAARATRRRMGARSMGHGDVRVVDWRPDSRPGGGAAGDDDETHAQWSSRWVVRGHFRNQPYGPGRAERKVIYVDSFIKGPEHLPIRDVSKVFRVRRRAGQ